MMADKGTKKEAAEMLKTALGMMKQLHGKGVKIDKIKLKEEELFIKKKDHFIIAPIYKDALKFIDLKDISFNDVDVHGVDFRGCNIGELFRPQEVFNKDLRGCYFDKVYISTWINFAGVDIRGCRFIEDDDPKTIAMFNYTFTGAIYDETTTYNGISFAKIFEAAKQSNESK